MNYRKKGYILFLIFSLLLIGFNFLAFGVGVIYDRTKMDYECRPVRINWEGAKQSVEVTNNSSRFELINKLQNIYSFGAIYMDGTSVILVGSLQANEVTNLMSLDIETEKLNWSACETEPMLLDKNHVYVGYTDLGGAFVTTYDVESGMKVWHAKVDNQGTSDIEITPIGLLITTNDHGRKRYYLLDENNGQQIRSFSDQYSMNGFFTQNGQNIFQLTGQGLVSSGIQNWETELDELPYRATMKTTLRNGVVLVDIRDHFISQIFALDNHTGAILWQTERNIKSDLAEEDGVVYFLTEDALLLAADLRTGTSLGHVLFSPGLKEMDDFDFVNAYPRVSVNDGVVVVYFDSARQLFAFSFSPEKL